MIERSGVGVFFAGMALLQAWPGRGFWQGTIAGQPGTLAGMVQTMAGTRQPHVLSAIVSSFGDFTAAHGFTVNLFAVLALAALGLVFCASALRGDARLARTAVIAGAVFCLADWLLVEDLGFLGGLGTDPNSMIPFILLFAAGYLGLTPAPQPAAVAAPAVAADAAAPEQAPAPAPEQAPVPEPAARQSPAPARLAAGRDWATPLSARSVAAAGRRR